MIAIRSQFRAEGVSVRDWALKQGFAPNAVYQVLSGRVSCYRGQSHQIAIRLGVKPSVDNPRFADPALEKAECSD